MLIKPMMNGFMGSGKTTIGREVATELGLPFLDLDDKMVASGHFEGLSIPDYIKKYDGDTPPFSTFRAKETLVLEDVVTANMQVSHVLSVGGGTYESPQLHNNYPHIQRGEYLPFFIDTPIEDILRRKREGADGEQHRMDLNEGVLRRIHSERYQNYRKSVGGHGKVVQNTGDISLSVEQILEHIEHHTRLNKGKS